MSNPDGTPQLLASFTAVMQVRGRASDALLDELTHDGNFLMLNRLALISILPLCILAATLAFLRMLWAILTSLPHARDMAIAFDQLANAATNGNPDETISSRANRARLAGRPWGCLLCRWLDYVEKGHCEKSAGM